MERKVYLANTPLKKAQELFLNAIRPCKMGEEKIKTVESVGRVTAKPIFARLSSPHYHASAMDGVAVNAADTFGASPTSPLRLFLGENAFYIDTGGALPKGCNAVIMIEELFSPEKVNPAILEIRQPATPWQHVRSIGEDIVAGEMILPSYHLIRPLDISSLLNSGIFSIDVLRKPRVGIIPTGTELIPPDSDPGSGQIIDSNSAVFAAFVDDWGGVPRKLPILRDDFQLLENALSQAAEENDLVLISAGSSAGRKDHTFGVLSKLGEVLLHGVAMRPGKPVVLGRIGTTPIVGIPGYPVAAFMALDLFVKPLLFHWRRQNVLPKEYLEATISRRLVSSLKEEEFLRMKIGKVKDKFVATPLPRGAGISISLVRADGQAVIPQNVEGLETGQNVRLELWRPRQEVENTIVCLGSHDLSLDILADFLRKEEKGYTLSSAHVGSMGGIMALKRGEAHLAGMHLLDPATGLYNVSYLQRYLPEEELTLIHLAQREQGLMVAPGNPKKISGFRDLCRSGIVFINRQKGAGTRLYLDFALQKEGLDPKDIVGYNREEFNHLAVAASVAAGSADVGLGIRAAADALGVDFIPVAHESYDLALPGHFFNSPPCQALLEIIGSASFRIAMEKMGGYNLEQSGQIIWRSTENV
ncbi:MAG TPA: molybdopterin biosynthesis protein [Firmicutes bacterium]|nr:molybdopterin biosynthesis protein [Bacillota bacterium]